MYSDDILILDEEGNEYEVEISAEECAQNEFKFSKHLLIAGMLNVINSMKKTIEEVPDFMEDECCRDSFFWCVDYLKKAVELLELKEIREALNNNPLSDNTLDIWISLVSEYLKNLSKEDKREIYKHLE